MKIMHISANTFPSLAAPTSTKAIWQELARDTGEYHVVGRSTNQKRTTEREGNIILHRLPRLLRGSVSLFLESGAILRLVKKNRIDTILAQCAIFGGVQAILCKKLYGTKVMLEIHGDHYFKWLNPTRGMDHVLNKVLRWVYRNADVVRVLNERMLEMLNNAKVEGKFEIIYNRVNMDIFSYPKTTFSCENRKSRLISVGSFVERKGYCFAIEALSNSGHANHVELTLIGGGEQKSAYEKMAAETGVSVQLHDRIPQEEFVKYLNQADIYIQPSYSEAVPRAIIEAMAMRLPILASNAGMTEGLIIHGENGLIFEKGNQADFLEKLEMLLSDEALRKRLAENAYRDAREKYEWNRCFDRYREILYTVGGKDTDAEMAV